MTRIASKGYSIRYVEN